MDRHALIKAVLKEQQNLKDIRRAERSADTKGALLADQPLINRTGDLEYNLKAVLPKQLVPSNVGSYKEILWPYWLNFEFDYDVAGDSVFTSAGIKEVTKQISQEAGFIVISAFRDYQTAGQAGRGAPLQVTIKDRQSTRQFNDNPIQIQHIGEKGEGTKFPTPYVFMPNARITLEISSILGADYTVVGESSKQRISLFGYRIRTEDASKIAEKIYL